MKIAIIKYGMGNVASVKKAIDKLGFTSIITNNITEIKNSDVILLPGVGSFKKGMENLNKENLVEVLKDEVLFKKKPFIGICLGMQLIATNGTEPENVKGLGWIDGDVIKIESPQKFRIPHLGWNTLKTKNNNNFYKEFNNKDVYFIHSYHFKAKYIQEVTMSVNYDIEMVAALQKNNIYAMQFHPEKSQEVGVHLLNKILTQYAKV